jgi:hypothetical protein
MKVTARFNAPNRIPGNNVAEPFGDLKVAVRANPGLIFFCICTDAGLSRVLNATFDFRTAKAQAGQIEVKLFDWLLLRL